MSNLTIDTVANPLPTDDTVAQKVPLYNAPLAGMELAWTAWTPTWTNLTLGNGTVTAKYRQIGKLVFCRLSLVFGTTTSVSGDVTFSLPVTKATYGGNQTQMPLGLVTALDSSAGVTAEGMVKPATTTTCVMRFLLAGGTYVSIGGASVPSSTVPFTWASADEIHAQLCYEAA